jgi:O-antigen/teichoic acid export membrane protein
MYLLTIKSGHARSQNIKKNVIVSFLLKGISIGVSLLLVPMVLNCLDKDRYGLWLTLSSIIGWFSLFDIGLGNGFRNRFAEALAVKNVLLARIYVSTTFALLSIIIGIVLIIFFVINPILDWGGILNTTIETGKELSLLVSIVFTFFCLQFVFKLTTSILLADQKPALVDFIGVLGSLLSLAIIYILIHFSKGSLLLVGLTLSTCPVLVLIVSYVVMFTGKYRMYRPGLKYIDFKQSKSLMSLGFLFFIPQIASLVVFSTSNILIAQIFTPSEVTVYNIAFKYFAILTMFFQIILTPFWSAFTEAFVKQDTVWIKNAIHKLVIFWGISCFASVILIFASDFAYKLWVGDQIKIPIQLSISLAVYMCIANWNNIFVAFNAGVSKVFIQVCLSLFGGIIFIPLATFLLRNIGLIGIPMAMGLSILSGSIIAPVQYRKLIKGKARGIWNK